MKRYLIAYWTNTGSTRKVAQRLGEVLAKEGHEATVKDLSELGDPGALEGFDAFVVGAPVNGFRWRPEALEFLRANAATLNAKPTALFLLSVMYGQGSPRSKKKALGFLNEAKALIRPATTGFFGGVMAAPPPAFLRFFLGIPKDAPLDARDWDTIDAWGRGLGKLAP